MAVFLLLICINYTSVFSYPLSHTDDGKPPNEKKREQSTRPGAYSKPQTFCLHVTNYCSPALQLTTPHLAPTNHNQPPFICGSAGAMFVSMLFKSLLRIYRVKIVIRAVTRAAKLQLAIMSRIPKKKTKKENPDLAGCTLGREIPVTRARQAAIADYLPPSNKARP